eukprot:52769_1
MHSSIVLQQKSYPFCKHNESVINCICVKNTISTLQFYQQLTNCKKVDYHTVNEKILQHFKEHPTIVNDYHHIVLQHLSSGNKQQNNLNFRTINNLIQKSIICDISNCMKYENNQRGRNKKIKGDEYTEEKLMNETFKLVNPKAIFYNQFLDTIHCYFIHAFDSGKRFQFNDTCTEQLNFEDKHIKELINAIKPVKDSASQQFNKFATEISDDNLQQTTEVITDNLLLDKVIEHMKQQKIPSSIIESFYMKLMTEEYD